MTGHWQVVEITGVGLGEMWFNVVSEGLTQRQAETRSANRDRHVAVPMPYSPDEPVGIGKVVDHYDREIVDQ